MEKAKLKSERQILFSILMSGIVVVGFLSLVRYLDFDTEVYQFLEWVRQAGNIGLSIFFLTVAIAVVLLLPTVLFTLAAGYIYGIAMGTLLIVVANSVGACIAFGLARRYQHYPMLDYLRNKDIFKSIGDSLTLHGWRMIALIRMIPFFPFKLSNYFFGLTTVPGRQFFAGTMVGLCPIAIFNVYLGSLAGDLMSVGNAGVERTPLQWALSIAGFLIVCLLVVLAGRSATRKFHAEK